MKSDYTPSSSSASSSSSSSSQSSSSSTLPSTQIPGHSPHDASRLKSPTRKSPPPPKLNLDDCRPRIHPAVTNTTSNPSSNSGTAFVFTSSRTLRTLQSQPHSSIPSALSTPSASPSTPPLSPSAHTHKPRPSLTTSQLAKHSQGALDARCIVGPNMRAAGFVPLAHTLTPLSHSRHHSTSSIPPLGDSLPPTPGVPTPSEPPPFPPIMFVNPSVVATTPMWEYQRAMGWGGPGRQSMGLAIGQPDLSAPVTLASPFIPAPVASPRSNLPVSHSSSSNTVATLSSTTTSASGSFFSSTNSSWSSVPGLKSHAADLKAKDKVPVYPVASRLSATPVDGYPFPPTPPRSKSESPLSQSDSIRSSGYSSSSERESSIAVSPISSTESTASNYTIPTTSTSFPSSTTAPPPFQTHRRAHTAPVPLPRPKPTPVQPSTKYTPGVDTPTFATARKRTSRPTRSHELSLTELCDNSPRAWTTDPDCLGPLATPPSSVPSGSSSGSSISGSARASQERSRAASTATDVGSQRRGRERARNEEREWNRPKHRIPPVVADVQNPPVQEQGVIEIIAGEVALASQSWDPVKETKAIEGDQPKEKPKVKDRERQSSTSPHHSHGHGHKGYSSFLFPPTSSSPESSAPPHMLGDREKAHSSSKEVKSNSKERREQHRELRGKEREHHHREKDLGALVQAHRDRDREQARQSERERRDALELAKAKEIAIDSDVNEDADVDVVHGLDQEWNRLQRVGLFHDVISNNLLILFLCLFLPHFHRNASATDVVSCTVLGGRGAATLAATLSSAMQPVKLRLSWISEMHSHTPSRFYAFTNFLSPRISAQPLPNFYSGTCSHRWWAAPHICCKACYSYTPKNRFGSYSATPF